MRTAGFLAGASLFFGPVLGQFPPKSEGFKTLQSKFHENVTISYKEPNICETDGLTKSYTGYVHLPPGFLDDVDGEKQDYPVNTFFWFFEARMGAETAPLAIWLNGGPGGSSLLGLFGENGPCVVNEDSKTTDMNPWSWNNFVNILYIDEPNQVGFSYDEPTNGTLVVEEEGRIHPSDFSHGDIPAWWNVTHKAGTFSSQKPSQTTNSTAQAAHALWHFAQTWFSEFPAYKPDNDKVSLWAESYGGHYGPGFMRFFQQQNEKIEDGRIGGGEGEEAHYIHLDTLGIVNGLVDMVIQGESYIDFPYNNTYDIQVFNESIYTELKTNWTQPGGCKDQFTTCQDRLGAFDVNSVNRGLVPTEEICDIQDWCQNAPIALYQSLGYGWFDIAHPLADPFPPPYLYGYLTQEHVLGAIGTPVNFSAVSQVVYDNFQSTGDVVHGGFLDAIAALLDSGVKVHMMYGDRDYACNWLGGERASLAVPYSRQADFAAVDYGLFWTPTAENGGFSGLTRQLGNYSFTRIFQAGHMVPAYQPLAAYEFFMRATFDVDISSGTTPVYDDLVTDGEAFDRWIKNEAPVRPESRCYVLLPMTCEEGVWEKVKAGRVRIEDWFVVEVYDDDDDDETDDDEIDEL